MLTDFLRCLFLCSASSIDSKREGSPLKQSSKPSNVSPAHRPHQNQKQAETGGIQENHSVPPAAPQDACELASNGLVARMEQEKEDKQEKGSDGVRTDGMVNGDVREEGREESDGGSPPHTKRTATETHEENEESGTGAESEQRDGEAGADPKVGPCVLIVVSATSEPFVCLPQLSCCSRSAGGRRKTGSAQLNLLYWINWISL